MRVIDDLNVLANALEPYGLTIRSIPKDGNCLFRSMADQLYGAHDSSSPDGEERHQEIRKRVVEYLRQNEEAYACFIEDDNSFEEYCESLSQWGTWGGQLELHIISLIYEVNIMIHQANGRTWVVENFPKDTQRCCQLAFHNQDHYNSVRFMEERDAKCPAHHTTVTIIGSLTPGSRGLPPPTCPTVGDAAGLSQRERSRDASRNRRVTVRDACQSDASVVLEYCSNSAFWKVPQFPSHIQPFTTKRGRAEVEIARARPRCRSAPPNVCSKASSAATQAAHMCVKGERSSLVLKEDEEHLNPTTCDARIPHSNASHAEPVPASSAPHNAKAKVAWRQAKAMALKEKRLKRTQRRQERGTHLKTTSADDHQPSLKSRLHFTDGVGSAAPSAQERPVAERRHRQRSYSAFTAEDADCASFCGRFPHGRGQESDYMKGTVSTLGLDSALRWVLQTFEAPHDRGTNTTSETRAVYPVPFLDSASSRSTAISQPSASKAVDRAFATPHSAHMPSSPSQYTTQCVSLDKTRAGPGAPGNATEMLTSRGSSSSLPPSLSSAHDLAPPCGASSTPVDALERSMRSMCHSTVDPSIDGVVGGTQPVLSPSLAVHRCIMTMT